MMGRASLRGQVLATTSVSVLLLIVPALTGAAPRTWSVTVLGSVDDSRLPAVTEAVEYWNQQLESVGSSMEKVLKCNVYLNDLKDYAGMNEVFQGRFGAEPPVRTTIAAAGGIPGNSLVEIDVIAAL